MGWQAAVLVCTIATAGPVLAQNDVAATVNGDAIPVSEFFDRLQRVSVRDFIVSTSPLAVRNQTAGQLLLDQMINERLTLQWATKTNQLPTDAYIASELARAKASPPVQQALATHQITEEFLKNSIRYRRAHFNLAVTAASVSPADVEKYYKDHLAAYTVPERYTLEGFDTSKQVDLPKIQADLKAGKSFQDVLKVYCEDQNVKSRNGAMGTFNAMDQNVPPAIREAAAALKEGQTSPPVKVEADQGGGKPKIAVWWFIRLVHREPSMTQPFAVVKPQVEEAALLERAGGIQVADKKIADFRQVSEIKINLPAYDILLPKPKK
jgi:parvulin-like peptidyl-prolyl isomerase